MPGFLGAGFRPSARASFIHQALADGLGCVDCKAFPRSPVSCLSGLLLATHLSYSLCLVSYSFCQLLLSSKHMFAGKDQARLEVSPDECVQQQSSSMEF